MFNKLLKILEVSNLFITGGGGVGKSYTTQKIINHYRNSDKNVISLGSTGISAVNIGGVTLHSFFCFGICKNIEELKRQDRGKFAKERLNKLKEILKNSDLIVIDEISMVSSELFDMIYYRLVNSNFKGKLLVVGDFYQLPPVIRKNDITDNNLFYSKYAFSSYSWEYMKFQYVEFLKSKRTEDLKFYEILSHIRIGDVSDEVIGYISKFLTLKLENNDNQTVLFGRNKEAEELNKKMLYSLPSELEVAYGYYEIFDQSINKDKLSKWLDNLNVIQNFEFKIGTRIIFTSNKYKNIYNKTTFFNGEQGIIRGFEKQDGAIVSIEVEKSSGEIINVEPNSYDLGEYELNNNEVNYRVLASFYQFPLRLAYGITIHKSQGMSIRNLVCDLNHIFAEGQLYVALSRAIDPNNLSIVYNRYESFSKYLKRVIKTSSDVASFYEKESFLYLD